MSHKAPSAGTKVTTGRNAPVTQEGPGAINDSLAAESEAFRQANRVEGASISARAPGSSTAYTQGSMPRESGTSDAQAAPTYVNSQYRRDPSGPHGKNITEDNSIGTEDRSKNASFAAEIGSKDDPSLLAEQKFSQANSLGAGAGGARQRAVDDKTPYDALGEEAA
ncbi:hypothetical protein F5B22DRAFT_110845 [Xylaria bambusicola]|uniref:uncharacterized protein n=1 Tax=Xylaria bambusicola TaxID=326684 RepID=UPI002007E459|nr:uncharacterized protein F5B22DRAFT_110845 [Xylaria bambusicola]KAI0517597.1 hypothetical protein F5B22DRAFT_110845 [Xylaria bambusicola]